MKKIKNNEKFLFIAILCIIFIIIIVIGILIKRLNENNESKNEIVPDTTLCGYSYSNDENIDIVDYFNIKTCMDTYLNNLNKNARRYYEYDEKQNYNRTTDENEIKKTMFNMLSEKYINENNISIENIYQYLNTFDSIKDEYVYIPLEMKLLQKKQISTYLIHGLVENLEYNVVDDVFVIINLDMIKNVFSIEPIKGKYSSIEEINIDKFIDNINKNDNNNFIPSRVKEMDIAENFMDLCKMLIIGKPDIMYNFLDENYRNARFENVQEFENYVSKNKEQLKIIKPYGYTRKDNGDYTEYVCVDTNGNYYIFNMKTLMQYTLILDTYTLDLTEFTEKYNTANDQEKVILNLNKINLALNAGDYKYVYSKLADSYKNNNFPTLSSFETYARVTFYTKNQFEYITYEAEGESYYTYEVEITDKTQQNSDIINKTFIMQLRRRY